jgi:hypothetical protein
MLDFLFNLSYTSGVFSMRKENTCEHTDGWPGAESPAEEGSKVYEK